MVAMATVARALLNFGHMQIARAAVVSNALLQHALGSLMRASGQLIRSFRHSDVLVNCISFEAWGRNVTDSLMETDSPVHTSTPVQFSSALAPLLAIAAASADDTSLGTTDVVFSPRLITPSRSDSKNQTKVRDASGFTNTSQSAHLSPSFRTASLHGLLPTPAPARIRSVGHCRKCVAIA